MIVLVNNYSSQNVSPNHNFLLKYISLQHLKTIIVNAVSTKIKSIDRLVSQINKHPNPVTIILSGSNYNITDRSKKALHVLNFNKKLILDLNNESNVQAVIGICYGQQVIALLSKFKFEPCKFRMKGLVSIKNAQNVITTVYANYSTCFNVSSNDIAQVTRYFHTDEMNHQVAQLYKVIWKQHNAFPFICFTFHPEALLSSHGLLDDFIQ